MRHVHACKGSGCKRPIWGCPAQVRFWFPSRDHAAPLVTALSGTRRARLSFLGFTPMPLRPELQAMLGNVDRWSSTWALAFEAARRTALIMSPPLEVRLAQRWAGRAEWCFRAAACPG